MTPSKEQHWLRVLVDTTQTNLELWQRRKARLEHDDPLTMVEDDPELLDRAERSLVLHLKEYRADLMQETGKPGTLDWEKFPYYEGSLRKSLEEAIDSKVRTYSRRLTDVKGQLEEHIARHGELLRER